MIENRNTRRSLAGKRPRAAVGRRGRRSNPLLVLLAVLALAVQLFVVQTHIHVDRGPSQAPIAITDQDTPGLADQNLNGPTPSGDHYPIKDDPSNCPLCQAFAHSGHFVQSAQVLILLPALVSAPLFFFGKTHPTLFLLSHS